MSQKPPSLARILLLLVGSMIAGLVVSSWLMTRMDNRLHKAYLLPEQSLVMESP